MSPAAPAKVKRPVGAVKLAAKNQKKIGKVRCGRIKSKWLSGAKLDKTYFVSDTQQYKNFTKAAKKKKGKARKALLKKAASFKAKAKKGTKTCNPVTGGTNPNPGGGTVPVSGAPLKFAVSGATGVALQSGAGMARSSSKATISQVAPVSGSNLDTVTETGQVKDAIVEGAATVSKFLIAPNGKLYTIFQSPANVGGVACLLAEVDVPTGVPTCIDSTLQQIDARGSVTGGGVSTFKNPVVQFDSKGSILYTGRAKDGRSVLRKYLNGTTTDLITDNVSLLDFLVRADDSVIIAGSTTGTGAVWTRRVNPAGGLQSLKNETAYWLYNFPDGNAYMGFNIRGVDRFLTSTSAMDPKDWIAKSPDAYNDSSQFCGNQQYQLPGGAQPDGAEMCYGSGAFSTHLFSTTDDKVFGVTKSNIGNAVSQMFEYYPGLRHPQTAVKDIKVAQGVITNVVMSGLNAAGQNITTVLNTSNDVEKSLIPPETEIEVYHVNYVAAGNKVMFDGLRFSDNKYIIGQVTLSGTPIVSTIATGTQKWADVQSFG
jgi:Zn-finger nucleic acid-binding protein